jgi:CheY-like chemotaxis protein
VLTKPFDVLQVLITFERAARIPMVLVIDDGEQAAISTAASLCEAGVRARPVSSAGQAIGAMKNGDVDLCVVNVVVPELQGGELARRLREIDPNVGQSLRIERLARRDCRRVLPGARWRFTMLASRSAAPTPARAQWSAGPAFDGHIVKSPHRQETR